MATNSQLQMQKQDNTTRLAGTPRCGQEYHTGNKPCPGCREEKQLHYRENCPNKNKVCYNCGRLGHIREVCRTMKQQLTWRNDSKRTKPWLAEIDWDRKYPLPTSKFRGMSQFPYLSIRNGQYRTRRYKLRLENTNFRKKMTDPAVT